MQIKKKTYFTLLEVLTVLLMLSLGLALTGVSVNKLYKDQRFLSETEQVLSHLGMAQDLMLILDADVKVTFKRQQNRTFLMWIDVEKPLQKRQEKIIQRKITLSTIKSIRFNDKFESPLILTFSLGNMSRGILELAEAGESKMSFSDGRVDAIVLPGYPSPLRGVMSDARQVTDQIFKMKRRFTREEEAESLSKQLFPAEVYEVLQKNNTNK